LGAERELAPSRWNRAGGQFLAAVEQFDGTFSAAASLPLPLCGGTEPLASQLGVNAMGRGILLWLLGVPIPIILLIALLYH